MGYAICRIEKINSSYEMQSRYKHNFREYDVSHANGELSHLNREIKGLNGKTYMESSDEELIRMRMNGYSGKRERKDAVRGLEVILSYSYDDKDSISLDRWINKNVEWLEEKFNPKDHQILIKDSDGSEHVVASDNVKSIMVHLDEAVPHIHAFIVPIDEKGALNAKRYTFNRQMMQGYQTSYAEAMKEFGLKRGAQNTKTTYQDVAKYHSALMEAVSAELPEPFAGEDILNYRERANVEFQREKIQHRNDVLTLKQEVKEAVSDKFTTVKQHYSDLDKTGYQIKKLAREMGVKELDDVTVRQIRRDVKQVNDFKDAVKDYPDKDESKAVLDSFNKMIQWQRSRERKKKKKEEKSFVDEE